MTHEPLPGVRATLRMEGDAWETEDHRNWTDASFKTYSRPLELPRPYTIAGGTEVRQTVTLRFDGELPREPAVEGGPVTVALGGGPAGPMPRLGLSVLPEDAELALVGRGRRQAGRAQHLNCRIDLRDAGFEQEMRRYRELALRVGAEVVLEIIVPGVETPADEVGRAAAASAGRGPASGRRGGDAGGRPQVLSARHPFSRRRPVMGGPHRRDPRAFPGIRVGGGMLSNFTELNRKRPPAPLLDFVTHATSTLIHACDDRTVMENLKSIAHIVRSTRAFWAICRIGSVPRTSATASTPTAPTTRRTRTTSGSPWSGSSRATAGCSAPPGTSATSARSQGRPRGRDHGLARGRVRDRLRQAAARPARARRRGRRRVYPVFHVFRGLAGAWRGQRIDAESSDPGRLRCLAWRDGGGTQLWLANLRNEPLEVRLDGMPAGPVSLWMLDEHSFEAAAIDPNFGERDEPFPGGDLTLQPFAVARLSFEG